MDVYQHTSSARSITWVRASLAVILIHFLTGRIAPEYALDEALVTASDMYSLGCLIYAVHCKGNPPFKNHGSLGGLRENAGRSPPGMERLDSDLQGT
jgi:hypothetical protein